MLKHLPRSSKFYAAGLSLLELMLVLSIVVAMVALSVRYYGNVSASKNVTATVSMISSVRTAVDSYTSDRGGSVTSIPSVATLVSAGYLPDSFNNGTPFGGTITTGGTVGGLFTITATNVPSTTLCTSIEDQLKSTINTSLGESVTISGADGSVESGSAPPPSSGSCGVVVNYMN